MPSFLRPSMAKSSRRRRRSVRGVSEKRRRGSCCWQWVLLNYKLKHNIFVIFSLLSASALVALPSTTSAIPFPDEAGYLNGGNFTMISYHLPESEDDFADVSDGRNLDDNVYKNGTQPVPPDDVTDPSSDGLFDHIGDGMKNAEILPDDGDGDYDERDYEDEEEGLGDDRRDDANDGEEEEDEEDEDDAAKDVVQQFLEEVERYETTKANCTAGTSHNLGKGVIKQYGLNRFKAQALVAVNRANLLTRIWKQGIPAITTSEYFFFTLVRSMLEGDPEIFAAGNCYDKEQFKDYYLFCPYAYRTSDGTINVKDLSVEYDFLAGNGSEWFVTCRQKANKVHNITRGK